MFPHLPNPAFRTHCDNLIDLYVGMAQCWFDATQSLTELNLQLGRDLIAEAGANTQRLMASRDTSQLGSAMAAQFTPGSPAFTTYQRRVSEVLSRCHAATSQTAADRMPAVRKSASAMADNMLREAATQTARAAEQLARFQPGSQLRH
ncbi:phasin family protein [Duganella sp. 1224]|uniref:phasin family protein n=1 Tax=Duganella sp. 1224 TaxID=2587052 RepID=UPI0015CA4DAC|nr:phasin family protein [Duganella sp. 1224]NYE60999.1 phasin family protein [Duganella sp. 1224]